MGAEQQVVSHGMDWVAAVIQLVTAGGFGALVWYLVVKHIPFIETRHHSERTEWREYIERRDSEFQNLIREHRDAVLEVTGKVSSLQTSTEGLRDELRHR